MSALPVIPIAVSPWCSRAGYPHAPGWLRGISSARRALADRGGAHGEPPAEIPGGRRLARGLLCVVEARDGCAFRARQEAKDAADAGIPEIGFLAGPLRGVRRARDLR